MDGSGKGTRKASYSFMVDHMPGVAALAKARRREHGDAHVDECWKRGVLQQQPGWFFAREGALAVGVPWPAIADVAGWQVTATQSMLFLAPRPEVQHGP